MKRSFHITTTASILFCLLFNFANAEKNEQQRTRTTTALQLFVPDNAPPIHLISFSAIASGEMVQLAWSTGSEVDNDFFTVERSPDGVRWDILEIVQGNGTISTQLSYGMNDHNPYPGTSFYRLKQTDFNGASTYSDEQEVFIMNTTSITVYPNPATTMVSVEAMNISSMDIRLLNVSGQEIPVQLTEDGDRVWVALNTLPPGTYFLSFQKGEFKMTEKLVIE